MTAIEIACLQRGALRKVVQAAPSPNRLFAASGLLA